MGRNSKQRRDARRRTDSRTSGGASSPFGHPGGFVSGGGPRRITAEELALADLQIVTHVRGLGRGTFTEAELGTRARALVRSVRDLEVLAIALEAALVRIFSSVVGSGWDPLDLHELTSRHRGPDHVPALAWLLVDDHRRNPVLNPDWVAAVAGLGAPRPPSWRELEGVALALSLAALLARLPSDHGSIPRFGAGGRTPASAPRVTSDAEAHRKLATVRALLAKAESTTYDEEAETLTAKAQELISRYALERLLDARHDTDASDVVSRKLWIDSPYVVAKASLIHAVADANRCRSVLYEPLAFSTVVGSPADLDAVELLCTSLLTQATAAMVRHGQQVDRRGASRTRSFRQAFLLAYATRIGQRLTEAGESALQERADAASLLPVLHRHNDEVEAAFTELFPQVRTRSASISNHAGYEAGRVAADLASLDFRGKLT